MKCLTIHNPYAHLIVTGKKLVENRTWDVARKYNIVLPIQLLIHAGKSREWLDLDPAGVMDVSYDIRVDAMPFGAIVGVVEWWDCFTKDEIEICASTRGGDWKGWALHEHTEGPWC